MAGALAVHGELQVLRLYGECLRRTVKLLGGLHSSKGSRLIGGRNVLRGGFQQRFNLSGSVVQLLGDCAIRAAF